MDRQRKGSVLIVVLWILAGLVFFALSIGHNAGLNLRIAAIQKDNLNAYYTAKSGLAYAVKLFEEDSQNSKTQSYDTTQECGISLNEKIPDVDWGVTGFTIDITDAESRININPSGLFDNKTLLTEVFTLESPEEAQGLASLVNAWTGENDKSDKAYKNQKLSVPEELMPVFEYYYFTKFADENKAISQSREEYGLINGIITIYGDGHININTASLDVLRILCRYCRKKELNDSVSAETADALAEKIAAARNAKTFISKNGIDTAEIGNGEEKLLFNAVKSYLVSKSDIFRVTVTAACNDSKRTITAVYARPRKKFVYWNEG